MSINPTVSAGSLMRLLRYGQSRGLDRQEMLDAAGIVENRKFEVFEHLPLAGCLSLWELFMHQLGDPDVPLKVARQSKIEDYYVYGFSLMTVRNGRQAFERSIQHFEALTTAGRLSQITMGARVGMTWHGPQERSLGQRVYNENLFAEFVQIYRQLLGESFRPLAVHFRHVAPALTAGYDAFFGVQPLFGSTTDRMVFSSDWLVAPIPWANESLASFFDLYIEKLLPNLDQAHHISSRARRAVRDILPKQTPTSPNIAKRLALSERSLRRRLRAEGTSLRVIVAEVRKELAEQLLAEGRTSTSEIAYLLGFSDLRSFDRAFKRWHGITPSAFRTSIEDEESMSVDSDSIWDQLEAPAVPASAPDDAVRRTR